ncbi:CDP-diacylglycerol--glycerol-3-phosphate 3-phosphatidyltransferase [Thermoactinomyces intermedius]|jgi:cardiolipin synthase (CMP-forming)|uniref:CDP-diacylglycerol--glycerol-3-phosphate 3-phosphatidyltransferase n=1 Tax=Thermoactinomyces intermedius TaxID=2024 RepID=A0A8I1DFM3_THEIN|nr:MULTISPECIES: CDP-diacylglycerol--glycerol-3-phosphate 3-phosphatidyltransferase [Thermoactinomyces]MBA4548162.1 CDP-diacylglycerol--glycerol-3-phosphate 3-phosphatidyltransferase [Thermoactinomyces intermedius]MBA4835274.1 CDP-diacylglycerol--glycerol-3-phosphate 3-phosphatidyltransferase [Thermoactinomyces intermedius]MBH8595006.1 CDP-diacylglycerol--glycerol-3-phosphate 3-phosphatidyltransferase [Thermoactinomyces intermedius]MBH8600335.1 CDP-diacylglycerol--glycerol-3-phosphate 3-phospha
MNLPNFLTMIRLFLIPAYFVAFFSDTPWNVHWAFGIILLAGFTDVIDGYVARKTKQVTQIGIMLDPLADKLMMLSVFLSLMISGKIGVWAAFIIVLRDVSMILFSVFLKLRGKRTVPANIFGKLTTFLFYVALFFIMFELPLAQTFLWSVIILSYITTLSYLLQLKTVNERAM